MDKEEFQPKNHQKSIPSLKGGNKFKPDRRFSKPIESGWIEPDGTRH
jgi:hypothetical protein